MTKIMKSKAFKAFAAFTLALALCLGTTFTAFAALNENGVLVGDESNPAKAAITKLLKMPEGTDTPAASFTFEVAKKDFNGATTGSEFDAMPVLGTPDNDDEALGLFTLSFTSDDDGVTKDRIKSVPKETGNIFESAPWPSAGIYTYTITETKNTYTIDDADRESMDYSNAKYDITAYVEQGQNGLFVSMILTKIVTTDGPSGTEGAKVDPTPGGDPEITGDYSKMTFTNTYLKNNGGPDPSTKGALTISKEVSGSLADKNKYFDFSLTITKPATVTDTPTYKAYVVSTDGTVVTSSSNTSATISTDANGKSYFEVTAGSATTIKLKHDERLVFSDLSVGAKYTVTEAASANYIPDVAVLANGKSVAMPAGALNTALTVPETLIGESTNSAAYTNAFKPVTPTGLDVNDLPFIMMLVLAAGAIVTFVVVKYRKKARTSAN